MSFFFIAYLVSLTVIFIVGFALVDSIKRNDQVLVLLHFLKGVNDALFTADSPNKVLVTCRVVHQHALLVNHREFVRVYSRWIIAIITKTAATTN